MNLTFLRLPFKVFKLFPASRRKAYITLPIKMRNLIKGWGQGYEKGLVDHGNIYSKLRKRYENYDKNLLYNLTCYLGFKPKQVAKLGVACRYLILSGRVNIYSTV